MPLSRHIYHFLTASMLCCLCIGCGKNTDTKTLFLAHTLPTSHPVHQGMVAFQEILAEQSQGKLVVRIFPDGQLGNERELLELLQIGSVAMTKVSAAAMASFAPAYEVLGIPYLFRDKTHLFNALEGDVGEDMLDSSRDFWLQGLCFYDAGSRSFYTKEKPVRSPDDLTGLKIRVMNHQMSVEMVNAMGGSATPMSYGELYTALQQGVVDGAENNPPSFVSSNHFEVCKYYSLDEHTSIPDVLVIGTKFWNKLSPQEQKWVKGSAMLSVEKQKQYWAESVTECMEILTAAGVEIIRPEKNVFAQKTQSIVDRMSKDPKMKTIIDAIQTDY